MSELHDAINEYLDIYECLTQGNPLKGFALGREPREKLYAAVGRTPLPENIPAGWQDPAIELGSMVARLRQELTALRAANASLREVLRECTAYMRRKCRMDNEDIAMLAQLDAALAKEGTQE